MDLGGRIPDKRKSRCKVPEVGTYWVCLRSQYGWSRVSREHLVGKEGRKEPRIRTHRTWRGLQPRRCEQLWDHVSRPLPLWNRQEIAMLEAFTIISSCFPLPREAPDKALCSTSADNLADFHFTLTPVTFADTVEVLWYSYGKTTKTKNPQSKKPT